MSQVDFEYFDCDNHFYEALDAFTRHIEPAFRKRGMQWVEIDGKQRLMVGEKAASAACRSRPRCRRSAKDCSVLMGIKSKVLRFQEMTIFLSIPFICPLFKKKFLVAVCIAKPRAAA